MQAILLLAHMGYDFIDHFCEQFNNDVRFYIYIHYDKKLHLTSDELNRLYNKYKNIKCIDSVYNCEYSRISIVDAELWLIKTALKDNNSYYHLMSEQCYLTIPCDTFCNFFCSDTNYIQYTSAINTVDVFGWSNIWRIQNNKHFYYGTQWWSLTHDMLSTIINHSGLNNYYIDIKQYSDNPKNDSHRQAVDETFFQNFIIEHDILMDTVVNKDLRYVNWRERTDNTNTHPVTLSIYNKHWATVKKDVQKLKPFIVRKIDYTNEYSINALHELQKIMNMTKPKVTVCMCTRNRAVLMLSAIKSILNQTFKDFELLVVNDCSTDKTEKLLKQLSNQDNRLRYITLPEHNFINARNTAFANANGEYIALIDSDDMCSSNKLEEQVKYLDEHPNIDVVGCTIQFGKKTASLSIPKSFNAWDDEYFKSEIETENISMLLHFPAIMIRKSTLDKIFPNKIYFYQELTNGGEDQIFLYIMNNFGAKFANINTCKYLYNYLQYNDAISATNGKHFNNDNFIFRYIHNKPYSEKMKKIIELYNKYSRQLKIAIISQIKDEHRYLKEWLDYNLNIGVTDIYLYEDIYSQSHSDIVKNYDNVHLVKVTDYLNMSEDELKDKWRQKLVFPKALKDMQEKYDWAICLDVDEFINIPYNCNTFLIQYNNVSSVALKWKQMTCKDCIKDDGKEYSVVEKYDIEIPIGDMHDYYKKSFVNLHLMPDWQFIPHTYKDGITIEYNVGCIKHYFTKTFEEYCYKLFNRGQEIAESTKIDHFFYVNPHLDKNALIKEYNYYFENERKINNTIKDETN